jgi:hypothetical protein
MMINVALLNRKGINSIKVHSNILFAGGYLVFLWLSPLAYLPQLYHEVGWEASWVEVSVL